MIMNQQQIAHISNCLLSLQMVGFHSHLFRTEVLIVWTGKAPKKYVKKLKNGNTLLL